ncbi:Protein bicaudal [Trichinella spiralis]|uniref:Protein bicaudal n=1 Tax=Trichinella spiralis TaxID=6334 RepID=A0ABR3KE52_TRISP
MRTTSVCILFIQFARLALSVCIAQHMILIHLEQILLTYHITVHFIDMTNPLSVESHLRHHFNNVIDRTHARTLTLDSTKRVQIDFDSMKFELEKLYEEMQVLRFQSDEASELKEIAERQVEEALRSLQQEREQRLALKKEVDQLKNAELFNSNMSNLAQSVFGMQILVDDKVSSPAMFKQLQASMEEDGESDHYQPMDLFSEMHGAQVKKLELELSSANRQREEMQKQLDEANRLVDQILHSKMTTVIDIHENALSKIFISIQLYQIFHVVLPGH